MNYSDLVFRDACIEDLPKIVAIYNSTVPTRLVTADTEPVTVQSRIPWFDAHNSQTRPLWVIHQHDSKEMIGWVSFQSFYGRPAYNATAEISIYLDPSARGKGVGKFVLNYSIDRAKAFGLKTILGYIFDHNEPSLKLFKRSGFNEWGHLPNIASLDGKERGVKILGNRIVK